MLLSALHAIFWGLLTLSVLVFIHEGGHFLAARACGVRVTEFFLGLPCRFNIHYVSKKIGTKFGVTPLLLGGYAAICGMDPTECSYAVDVLELIHKQGRASVDEIASTLSISTDDALEACVLLQSWGSISPVYETDDGSKPDTRYYATVYMSVPRDHSGYTVYDGKKFMRAEATLPGDSWVPQMSKEAFFEFERDKTYIGQGFWRRAFMLVAGICVNIVCGLLLLMSVYSFIGVTVGVNSNQIGAVDRTSIAYGAGLREGDTILQIGDESCSDWSDILSAVNNASGSTCEIVFRRDGVNKTTRVSLPKKSKLGISVQTKVVHLKLIDSFKVSVNYVVQTAQGVAQLLMPQHTKEILDNSTSVVGISIMSSEAAEAGVSTYLTFAALISLSLGFMNLLPIPPLDGGKLLIEIVQAVSRRKLSLRVQNALTLVGIALFGLLFVYMLCSDILRFIL